MMQYAYTEEFFWETVRPYVFGKQHMGLFIDKIVNAAKKPYRSIQILNLWHMETHCPIIKIIRNISNTISEVNISIQYTDTLKIDCLSVTFTTGALPNFNNFTDHMVCVKENLKLSLALNESYWMIFNVQQIGAQLSSRCLSIDGSSSKCWSILTYPKRHEPSLDIW
ncbi:uncharacterized protein LOC114939039 isoform X1 [Nylanderia fulva]|uniref:uncharacterized protein LOC114939039 isoform X1 n=2 Tax=Nylanderia fulva TaxID=613905 RepID=UPI0010FB56F0|nr:uncharacterized protein LOC114939039 isoform X1 [Nylanderia fulva]